MDMRRDTTMPMSIFYSYAHEDEWYRDQLEKHLRLLQLQGIISEWHDRKVIPGMNWAQVIDDHLQNASIILLLISPDFWLQIIVMVLRCNEPWSDTKKAMSLQFLFYYVP